MTALSSQAGIDLLRSEPRKYAILEALSNLRNSLLLNLPAE